MRGRAVALRELLRAADVRGARRLHNVADARRAARRRLPSVVYDYVDGAADDELALWRNEAAFGSVTFRPKMGSGCVSASIASRVLGADVAVPVILAPCGLVRLLHRDGAAGVARAAASRGTVSVLSTVAGSSIEEVTSQTGARVWFQLYASGGIREAEMLCRRASECGVEVLVVTVDIPALGNRERDVRHGVTPPLRVDSHNAVALGVQVFTKPRWAAELAATGLRLARPSARSSGPGDSALQGRASPFSWDDLARLRAVWAGALVVKGVLSGEDGARAVDAGADAIVVSNHGGRQLDNAPATLHALPDVVAEVGGKVDVLVDGGIRRGAHVVAALALGARAVMIGRPYLYGLAAAGEPGVERVVDILASELRRCMVLLGCPSIEDLGPQWLEGLDAPVPGARRAWPSAPHGSTA